MKSMTANERQEIRKLLFNRQQKELSDLEFSDPGWQSRVDAKVLKRAIGLLKIEKELVEKEALDKQISELSRKLEVVLAKIDAKMPIRKKEDGYSSCPRKKDLCDAIADLSKEIRDSETRKDPAGKKRIEISDKYMELEALLLRCDTREELAEMGVL